MIEDKVSGVIVLNCLIQSINAFRDLDSLNVSYRDSLNGEHIDTG